MKIKMFHVKHFPPGMNIEGEKVFFGVGLAISFLYSLTFLGRYVQARMELFAITKLNSSPVTEWKPEGTMEVFSVLLGNALRGFPLLALSMLGFVIVHYVYFWQGSKSIYLMKRLPNRMEIHKMAWSYPIKAMMLSIGCAFVLLVLYYGVYRIATPKECLLPNQWLLW